MRYSGYVIETEFLELLNSAPVVDGELVETLGDPRMREVRDALHAVIRGEAASESLNAYLAGVTSSPSIRDGVVDWTLTGPSNGLAGAAAVLEWARIDAELPGRLRPCGNPECNKFLIDHSKPNTARWCSMAECGNRMKARRHHARRIASVSA